MWNKAQQTSADKPDLQEGQWREELERIAAYLDIFKKKEALGLLEGLNRYDLSTDQEQQVQEIIKAVKNYDYERAIMLLRQ